MVSVYFPVFATTYGNKKVYCQQQKALLGLGVAEPVWKVFWRDFWECIDKWLEDGENLIIGGDWNRDVRDQKFLKPFRDRGLVPAITGTHGEQGPETYNKGTKPIDEIFVSNAIRVKAAGYLEHGESAGDHRPIWIEVSKESALGGTAPDLPSFKARKLKCHDPRIVERYNKALEKYLKDHNFFVRVERLFQTMQNPLTEAQMEEYEALDTV